MTRPDALEVIQKALAGWRKQPDWADKADDHILNQMRGLQVWHEPYALIFEEWAIVVKDRRTSKAAQIAYSEVLKGELM